MQKVASFDSLAEVETFWCWAFVTAPAPELAESHTSGRQLECTDFSQAVARCYQNYQRPRQRRSRQ